MIQKAFDQAKYLQRALLTIWRSAPAWTAAHLALVVLQGLLPLAALFVTKGIVDSLSSAISGNHNADEILRRVMVWVGLGLLVAILTAGSRSLADYVNQVHSQAITNSVLDLLHKQSLAVDLAFYEDSAYHDTFHRAQKEAAYRPSQILYGIIQVSQNAISLLGIVALLFSFNWLLGLVLFAVTLPGAGARYWYSRKLYGFEQKQTETEREVWYYHWLMVDSRFAKEVRLFNLGHLFTERYRSLRDSLYQGRLSLSKRRSWASFWTQALASVAVFGTIALAAYESIRGMITIGALMVIYIGFQNGLEFLQNMLQGIMGLYEDNLFLSNFYQFLDLQPAIRRPQQPAHVPETIHQGIHVQGLSFCYPGSERQALENINLSLKPGEVIALVGKNGSGKTTLVKLLCQLYQPTSGAITLDGLDLSTFDPTEWQKRISVVFQDYAQFYLKAWENIWLGNVDLSPDRSRIVEKAELAGVDAIIRRLPEGYESRLGKWFRQGQELSTGEWQKIALARAFWRDAQIVVLDEPTSSLDPLAEAELFKQFRQLIAGRSAILISHRFSTVQMADCIYVIDQGSILESGSHTELLKKNGLYAHLYRTQAESYQLKDD